MEVMLKRLISVSIVVSLVCGIYGCAQTAKDSLVAELETVKTENIEAESEETAISGEELAVIVRESDYNADGNIDYGKEYGYDNVGNQEIGAAYKLLNQDIFGDFSMDWYTDSLKDEVYEHADEVKGDFEAVPYEGDFFPPELISMAEEGLYHTNLTVDKEFGVSWDDETLDYLGADEFRLDLDEMYQLFPKLNQYKDEIETEYDAYNRIIESDDCSGIYHLDMASDEDYYVFVYSDGGHDQINNVRLTKQIDDEFVEIDEFEIQTGNGRIIQYENNYYYVYLYRNDILGCVDGIRIHKLGEDALHENILIRYTPQHYAWKNSYYNEDISFNAELDEYIDSIKSEITSDEYLEKGQDECPNEYLGDEAEAWDFVVENNHRYYKIDFANIEIPVYMLKSSTFPPRGWHIRTEFYLYDKKQDAVLELENLGSYWIWNNMVQIWFKEINQKVLTFRVYYVSDYSYVLNVILIEGDKITQIRNDIFSPDKSRFTLTEGEVFFSG